MQYRSLCCDSESMFNLVVYSSTHSLVGGTGDAIIQGRATVQRSFLFPCSSPTTFCVKNQKFFRLYASLPEANPLCALLAHAKARIPQTSPFSSHFTGNLQHQPRRDQRRLARFKNNFARNLSATACLGIRRLATRGRFSHFGQPIFCWFDRHHY